MKNRTISDFLNTDLRAFQLADINRSIPDLMDGLKPSQRKILYTCLKEGIVKSNREKLPAMAGSVQKATAYHHGEVSLTNSIVDLSQTFVGSNNINLLTGDGMFGTRNMGGSDSAAPRYLHAYLSNITDKIFLKDDNPILDYLKDDGIFIEPKRFYPIIPMSLVNGVNGVATGQSSFIPSYSPSDIITYIKNKLKKKKNNIELHPQYNGFVGDIVKNTETQYLIKGKVNIINTTRVDITELPIGMQTNKYVEILDELYENGFIKNFKNVKDGSDGQTPLFELTFQRETLKNYEGNVDGLLESLKLVNKISINNMHLISDGRIKKYTSPEEICDEYYVKRLEMYGLRKEHKLKSLRDEYNKISETARFIDLVINDKIKIYKRKKEDIVKDLEKNKFDVDIHNYLLSLSIISLTKEKLDDLLQQKNDKDVEINKLDNYSLEELQLYDLDILNKYIK